MLLYQLLNLVTCTKGNNLGTSALSWSNSSEQKTCCFLSLSLIWRYNSLQTGVLVNYLLNDSTSSCMCFTYITYTKPCNHDYIYTTL